MVNMIKFLLLTLITALGLQAGTITDYLTYYALGTSVSKSGGDTGYGLYVSRPYESFLITLSYTDYVDQKLYRKVNMKNSKSCNTNSDVKTVIKPGTAKPVNKITNDNSNTLTDNPEVLKPYEDDVDALELTAGIPLYDLGYYFRAYGIIGVGTNWNDTIDDFGVYVPVGVEIITIRDHDLDLGISYKHNCSVDDMYVEDDIITLKLGWSF